MIYAALADGLVDGAERKVIELKIAAAQREATSLSTYLANDAEQMTAEQKRIAVELVYRVMTAAGPLKSGHQRQLHNLSLTLQMPQEEFDLLWAELQRS